jgi:putative transposase
VTINKAFKFRIYPTEPQKEQLARQFGASRFLFNYFLRQRMDYYAAHKGEKKHGLNYFDTTRMLTQLKRTEEYRWLCEANSQSLQASLRHLDVAYNRFFNKCGQFPRFKSKRAKQSFTVPQHFALDVESKWLSVPKIGAIKIVPHRRVEGTVRSVTITKTPAGKYFASLLCEVEWTTPKHPHQRRVGVDLGLKEFAVTSEGELIESPLFFRRSELELARWQRRLARRQVGSHRRERAKLKVARCHERIANQRNDFLHKLSRRLVDENQAICLEDLNVKGMTANHCLAKSIQDSSWSEFVRQLEYKASWYGSSVVKVDRFFPSSKRCHVCGYIKEDLTLADREWTCPECGIQHHRDTNAAKNILLFGKECTAGHAETQRAGRHRVRKPSRGTAKPTS